MQYVSNLLLSKKRLVVVKKDYVYIVENQSILFNIVQRNDAIIK
ncbi:hypothetical protein GCM10010495_82630 [Kitasatospora herbaricolor]|nr:hypothetical protein GCM10010495_82630 [Kitasatospora herbaricolor]